ncbi:MAG: hypothetical protein Tsb0013_04580 [Phycisphaerales bacterium]
MAEIQTLHSRTRRANLTRLALIAFIGCLLLAIPGQPIGAWLGSFVPTFMVTILGWGMIAAGVHFASMWYRTQEEARGSTCTEPQAFALIGAIALVCGLPGFALGLFLQTLLT